MLLRSAINKEHDNGYNHAREEETEKTLPGKTQTPAADQTGSPQGKCVRSRIEKEVRLMKTVSDRSDCDRVNETVL
jgi:hypothetical protein